jgi:hypothetical protein
MYRRLGVGGWELGVGDWTKSYWGFGVEFDGSLRDQPANLKSDPNAIPKRSSNP